MARSQRVSKLFIAALGAAAIMSMVGGPAVAAAAGEPVSSPYTIGLAGAEIGQPNNVVRPVTKPNVVPADAVNQATGPLLIVKPYQHFVQVSPQLNGWSATLFASPTSLWPGQFTTLTARTNKDLSASVYFLNIYDLTANTLLASCGTGTTCSASVTQPTATTHTFIAVVSDFSLTYPPTNIQAASATIPVTWRSISVSLTASPTTTSVGGKTTLTARTSADVGPTPFFTEIFNTTTGALVAACSSGTVCQGAASEATATTDAFVAEVTNFSATYPPASGVQATSATNYVTWSNAGYSLMLSAQRFGTSATATATANINVVPNYIEIYDETTATLLGTCHAVSTCTSSAFTPTGSGDYLIAWVNKNVEVGIPPVADILASSNVAFVP